MIEEVVPPVSLEMVQAMADAHPAMLWAADTTGQCVHFNRGWLTFRGRTLAQEYGDGWVEGVHPEDKERCVSTYLDAFGRRQRFEMEYRLERNDGAWRWILDVGAPWLHADGSFGGYIGCCLDITSQRNELSDVRASEQRLRSTISALPEALLVVDDSGRVEAANDAARELLGDEPALVGSRLQHRWPPCVEPDGSTVTWMQLARMTGELRRLDIGIRIAGELRWFALTFTLLAGPGTPRPTTVVSLTETSRPQGVQDLLIEQAQRDLLTGLDNREHFMSRLDAAMDGSAVERVAVLCVELEAFDLVQRVHGRAVGDEVLIAVADRLRHCVRPADVVARIGDSTFGVLLDHVLDPGATDAFAARVRRALDDPVSTGAGIIGLAPSVGLAVGPRAGSAAELFSQAVLAVHAQRSAHRDQPASAPPCAASTTRRPRSESNAAS